MRILVIGSSGFIGSNVLAVLSTKHEVYGADRNPSGQPNSRRIDLLEPETIRAVIEELQPDAIISCAGVVDATQDVSLNVTFTTNLLEAVAASGVPIKRIIISGSAGEYGLVDPANIPVKETAPLNAHSGYGLSKLQETSKALELGKTYNLPVIIARIFNPIGPHMHPRLLVSRILEQIQEIKQGTKTDIEISRLDSKRDYIYVGDIALALQAIIEGDPKETVYNLGSGVSTSNGELIDLILKNSTLDGKPTIIETAEQAELTVASQADISRMREEFGWQPKSTLEQAVKEIINTS